MSVLYCYIPNRDIVDLVYRLIHEDRMRLLNQQYKSEMVHNNDNGSYKILRFKGHYIFKFNFRLFYNSDFAIANWRYASVRGCNSNPNHWHARLYK